jgi:hypothetical protein
MKKFKILFFTFLLVFALGVSGASATPDLQEWAFNVDGTFYDSLLGNTLPSNFNTAAFDFTTGLGTINVQITGAGNHNFIGFFDHDINRLVNGWLNELGSVSGAPSAGQSWQIDDPYGTIYSNVQSNTLDNTNYSTSQGDVSMAMGRDFTLASGETAYINLHLSETQPLSGFYLAQSDISLVGGPLETLYYTGTLDIIGGGTQVPEPGTLLLLSSGLIGLIGLGRKRLN